MNATHIDKLGRCVGCRWAELIRKKPPISRYMFPIHEQSLAYSQVRKAHILESHFECLVQLRSCKLYRLLPLTSLPFCSKRRIDQYMVMKHIDAAANESPPPPKNN